MKYMNTRSLSYCCFNFNFFLYVHYICYPKLTSNRNTNLIRIDVTAMGKITNAIRKIQIASEVPNNREKVSVKLTNIIVIRKTYKYSEN